MTSRHGITAAFVYYEHARPKLKAPFGVQTRRDTTDTLPSEPEYVHPDQKPGIDTHNYRIKK